MYRPLPPTLVLLLLLVAVPLGLAAPVLGPLGLPWRVAGLVPVLAGARLTYAAHSTFTDLGTEIGTFDQPGQLVVSGPFTYTRNPMYLGLVVALAGVALVVGSLTAWLGPLVFVVAADRWYIPFEERMMQMKFGRQYEAYRAAVPRWLGRARQSSHE